MTVWVGRGKFYTGPVSGSTSGTLLTSQVQLETPNLTYVRQLAVNFLHIATVPGATEAFDSHMSLSKVMLNFGPKQTALNEIVSSTCSDVEK